MWKILDARLAGLDRAGPLLIWLWKHLEAGPGPSLEAGLAGPSLATIGQLDFILL